jgi:hypothetical protein
MLFPGSVSSFSPLYVGVIGLTLAFIALAQNKQRERFFWGAVALIALLLSFGERSPLYHLFFNILPGVSFFRGQERAAYLVSNSLAILAGLGFAALAEKQEPDVGIKRFLTFILLAYVVYTAVMFVLWLGSGEPYGTQLAIGARGLLVVLPAYFLLSHLLNGAFQDSSIKDENRVSLGTQTERKTGRTHFILSTALIAFELFAVNMDSPNVYASVPPTQQLSFSPPPLVAAALADEAVPFRVDGNYRDLYGNYASIYGLLDIRGISPLFLSGPHTLIQTNQPVNPLAWEIFAVRYVFIDWAELPVASEIVLTAPDRFGTANLHRLSDPRPFAWLVYDAVVVDSDNAAYALLQDPNFQSRHTVILNQDPIITLSGERTDAATAEVTAFAPESFAISVNTAQDAILTIAHPDYPGWRATLDGASVEILRAYGATVAVVIPAGEHVVEFVYDPLTYRIGVLLSLFTWAALAILVLVWMLRGRHVQ